MNLTLEIADLPFGSLGRMRSDCGKIDMSVVGRPWIPCDDVGGTPFKSRVPNGMYALIPHKSPKHGDCYIMISKANSVGRSMDNDGSNRTDCLFHVANYPDEVVGCFGVGTRSCIESVGVARSTRAIRKLNLALGGEEHNLNIINGNNESWLNYKFKAE